MLGLIKRTGFALVAFCLSVPAGMMAQETAALYHFSGLPQSAFVNPAIHNTTGKLVIGMPLFSGVYGTWNSSVPLNSLFSRGFSYSFSRFYNALGEQGSARANAGVTVFYASLKHQDYTFSLSVSERGFGAGQFDREIVRFIRDGTLEFFGKNEDLGTASFFFRHYRELAPGISKQIWEGLDIGIRPKVLFGKLNFEMEEMHLSVESPGDNDKMFLKPEGSFKLSGPFNHKLDTVFRFSSFTAGVSPGDYFFQLRNLGVGVDFGMVYRPNKFAEWSFSITDAGLIGFRHNSFDTEFTRPVIYSENRPYQSHAPDEDFYLEPREALKAFGDSVSYIIDVNDAEKRNYSALPMKIHAAAKFRFSENTTLGASNQVTLFSNKTQNSFTPFVETFFFPNLGMYGSLTLMNFSAVLPGFGLTYTGDFLQFYLAGNNISGIFQPASAKHVNLCLGINFLFKTK
ncbi:MAG TPA: hypothetical protein ENN90_14955 [Mariniphaga anaerophila]|uniref:DUF5723 domain-containing protein n=1 Tax=Mariniphaga anaerophila TaxID=1484053 RepID=A0A831PLT2_9BACT|nr:hypothetical protein [Mariniphaga anaerophila]